MNPKGGIGPPIAMPRGGIASGWRLKPVKAEIGGSNVQCKFKLPSPGGALSNSPAASEMLMRAKTYRSTKMTVVQRDDAAGENTSSLRAVFKCYCGAAGSYHNA